MISSACRRFALRAPAGVLLMLAGCLSINTLVAALVPPVEACQALPRTVITRHFAWEDVNSWKVLGMEDDQEIVDADSPPIRFALEVLIDPLHLRRAIESYGIPEAWMSYSYRTEAERRRKEDEQTLRCAARGVAFDRRTNTLEPDYLWVVANSRDDVREAALKLRMWGGRPAMLTSRGLSKSSLLSCSPWNIGCRPTSDREKTASPSRLSA